MDTLQRFGSGTQVYTFTPDNQISIRDNFRNVVPRTTRLPGLSGGFDEFGEGAAPGEIGNVQVVFWIFGETEAAMRDALDAVGAMADWGVKRLYLQPTDATEDERYCEARVNSIDYNQNSSDRPNKRIRVTINFQVANPGWLGIGTEAPLYGDGSTFGSGVVFGGTATAQAVSGVDNDFSINPGGAAAVYPRITIACGAAQTATDIRIQREVQGVTVDEVRYNATLGNNDSLEINCRALTVELNGADAYGSAYSFQNAHWFKLEATSNTIRVLMDNAGDACSVTFNTNEAWK